MLNFKESDNINQLVKRIGIRFESYGHIPKCDFICYYEGKSVLWIEVYLDWWAVEERGMLVRWSKEQYKEVVDQLEKILKDTEGMKQPDEDEKVEKCNGYDHYGFIR